MCQMLCKAELMLIRLNSTPLGLMADVGSPLLTTLASVIGVVNSDGVFQKIVTN
jgi:hypothetical protein